MSTFNTVRITQLNEEISTLKEKTDLILDVVHLHEKHLHHIEEKLEQTNKLLADLLEANVWFTSKDHGLDCQSSAFTLDQGLPITKFSF